MFKFDSCTAPARGKIMGKIVDCVTGLPIVGAVVQVSDGRSGATDAKRQLLDPGAARQLHGRRLGPFRNCNRPPLKASAFRTEELRRPTSV
jgi:hypothetical protein